MFKEQKSFWLYFLGIILLFIVLFYAMRGYFSNRSPFELLESPFRQTAGATTIPKTSQANVAPEFVIDLNKNYTAILKTNKGEITLDLFEKNAPNTVNN